MQNKLNLKLGEISEVETPGTGNDTSLSMLVSDRAIMPQAVRTQQHFFAHSNSVTKSEEEENRIKVYKPSEESTVDIIKGIRNNLLNKF